MKISPEVARDFSTSRKGKTRLVGCPGASLPIAEGPELAQEHTSSPPSSIGSRQRVLQHTDSGSSCRNISRNLFQQLWSCRRTRSSSASLTPGYDLEQVNPALLAGCPSVCLHRTYNPICASTNRGTAACSIDRPIMAPKEAEVELHAISRTPEYEEFMAKLKAYHQERGTALEAEPKVGPVYLDLYKTFTHICANGGYDKVSDEKLAWRRMAEQLGIHSSNVASTAFSLKEKYYKNLAAYEIKFFHGKEPPPKDILEDVSAKGGGLLSRTRENFRGAKRDSGTAADSAAASGDDGTPTRERPTPDAAPTSSVRASRGLREAPPQRVIFQPDTGPARPTRHVSGQQPSHLNTPTPGGHSGSHHGTPQQVQHTPVPLPHQPRAPPRGPSGSYNPPNPDSTSASVESYLPRSLQPPNQQHVLPIRPVDTPSNNPAEFARRRHVARSLLEPPRRSGPYPGGKDSLIL